MDLNNYNINDNTNSDDEFLPSENECIELTTHLSDDILLENIEQQINKPGALSTFDNFIKSFNERYNYLISNYSDSEFLVQRCVDIKNAFFTKIMELFISKYRLSTDLTEKNDIEDLDFYVTELYMFFVIKRFTFIKEFFTDYIIKNSAELINQYKTVTNKKDLFYKNYKKRLTAIDKANYAYIIYNIKDIIKNYIEGNTFEEFIKDIYSIEKFTYDSSVSTMYTLFIKNEGNTYASDNTMRDYMDLIYNDETSDQIFSDIEFDIMNYLVLDYKNNKKN